MGTRKLILAAVLALSVTLLAAAETKKLSVDDVLFLKELEVEEATILKKIKDSGATFSAEDIEKLKKGGLSDDFLSKVQQPVEVKPKGPKLTVENVVLLKDLGIPEQTILTKIEESGTTFSAADVEALKKAGLSDDFVTYLDKIGALPEEKEEAVDAGAASEKLRNDVDELGDHFEDAAKEVEKFEENLSKLESLKDGGILTEEEFAQSVEKAGDATAKVLDEHTLKVLDLEKAIKASPMVREKIAAVDLASYVNGYLSALGDFVGLAHKGVPKQLEEARKKAEELKTNAQVGYDLYSSIVEPEEKEEKEEEEEEKPTEKGLAGSWQLKAAGIKVDLVLGDDGKFTWHYEAADETEDLKGTWKKVDDSTIEVQDEGDPTKSLMPCKLTGPDTLQITVEGVILQFNRVGEKNPKGAKEDGGGNREASDDTLDLSSPEAAVTTFIRGCQAKDLDLLSQCMSEITEEELKPLQDKTASPKMLDQLASMFRGATVESVDKPAATGAIVKVKLNSPRLEEQISVFEEEGCWKVQSF